MRRLDDEHIGGKLLLLLGDALITLLLTLGGALAWVSIYVLPKDSQTDLGAVIVFCAAAAAASAALLAWRRGLWAALALLAAGGLTIWRLWGELTEHWVLVRSPGPWDLLHKYPAALYLLCAMLALVMGLLAVRVRLWYLAAALSLALVLPAITGGTLPMWGAMLASFSGWGAMLLTAFFSRRDPEGLGRAQLLSLAGMWVLILVLVMGLPMEGYTRPQWATDARDSMIRGVTARMERFMDTKALDGMLADLGLDLSVSGGGSSVPVSGPAGENTGASGTAGTGLDRREDLLAAGPRYYGRQPVMTVSTDQPDPPGRIYLRGGSFGDYTGSSWESGGGPEEVRPEQFPILTAPDAPSYTLRIRDTQFQDTWYYPYRYDGDGMLDGDGRLTPEGNALSLEDLLGAPAPERPRTKEYRVSYRPGGPEDGFVPLEDDWAERLDSYRNDPYFTLPYLKVSLKLWDYLEPIAEEIQRRTAAIDPELPEQFREPVAAAARTASYLASVAVYDLSTPAMERGEDFVEHFLEEGRGYCVHFATAGVMLLRRQGIPARYVTGYVADLDSQGRGTILDSDAHAWVEIYLDGYGWYPVEMTPGYSGGGGDVTLSEEPAPPRTPETETPVEPDLPEEEEPERPEPDLPVPLPGEELPGEEAAGETASFPWRAVLGAVLALGAVWGGYGLSFLPRRAARRDPDVNRSVICAYRRCRRVIRLGGAEDERLEELGRKAKFSQHTLTEEERERAWKCLEEAGEGLLARRTGWRKALLRLLRPLL